MAPSLILLLRQGLMSKFSDPAFRHLISSMGLYLKIGVLPFFEKPLVITRGEVFREYLLGRGVYNGRNGRCSCDFSKEIFTLWGISC